MKQLYLKIQAESVKLDNVILYKRKERNDLVDAIKKAKKEKDAEQVEYLTAKRNQCDGDILSLEVRWKELEREFVDLKELCGRLRLNLYVFADIIYGALIEYKEFIEKHVINKSDDNDTIRNIEQAIDHIKQLPYEMALDSADKTNELYGFITERFVERWNKVRDKALTEIFAEVDNEANPIKKTTPSQM